MAKNEIGLPKGINETDLKRPPYGSKDPLVSDWDRQSFEMFYTERFGWVLPCLLISRASRRQRSSMPNVTDRSYAIAVRDKKLVSVGRGPHVKRDVTVYVRKSREATLSPFVQLRTEGAAKAGEYRDTLSSRRLTSRSRNSAWGF
jgi:hypothetical protein